MSNTVIGRNDLGLTIETFNNNGTIDPNAGLVATSVAITAITELPGSSNTQQALQALATAVGGGGVSAMDLASTALGKGASMVGVHDTAGIITATTVEGALAELKVIIDAFTTTYLTKATPTFTGRLVSTDRGDATGPAIGGNFTGGGYGLFFDASNFIGVARAGVDIFRFDSGKIIVQDNGSTATIVQLGADTALSRTTGGAGQFDNGTGLKVSNGLSSWGHAIPGSQPVAGVATAGGTYGANEQTMLQVVYNALRGDGTIS